MVEITPEIKKLIEENPLAFATVDNAGKPNVVGVAYVKVVSQNQIIISDNYMKQTKENIKSRTDVCLAVWDKTWNGIKIVGTSEYFDIGKWKKFVEDMPENKGLPAKGAILVTVSELIKMG